MKKVTFCLALFFVSVCVTLIISIHEPWFDEAQAWQIAKCASFRDILFQIPHYEGHPPLWHLILAIPAKLGVPFEVGLKSIGILTYAITVWLIVFRSPFPKAAKIMLPLSYFAFYQHGVVVRPYGLMLLTFLILAISFPDRNRHPYIFVSLLALLCLESAYGMLVACGMALCFAWDIAFEKGAARFFKQIILDSRTRALCILLILGLLLALCISPRPDTWVTSTGAISPFLVRLFCSIFTFLPECFLTSSSWFAADRYLLQQATFPLMELIAIAVVGIVLWVLLVCVGNRQNLKFIMVPYVLFSVFSAGVYMIGHHLGIVFMLALFWLWVSLDDSCSFEIGRKFLERLSATSRDVKLAKGAVITIFIACLTVPCYWTIRACIADWNYNYSFGREAAAFITQNNLDELDILSAWDEAGSIKTNRSVDYTPSSLCVSLPVEVTAYFDRNICQNLNSGLDDEAFFNYRLVHEADDAKTLSAWASQGAPDVLLGRPNLMSLYGGSVSYDDYALVHVVEYHYVWKDSYESAYLPIYVKKSLAEVLGLEVLNEKDYVLDASTFSITPEMRKQFENGVPVEEILDPYLDKMFGED